MTYLRYAPEMVAWLREWYPKLDNEAVMGAFEAEFGVRPSPSGLQSKCSSLGIRKPVKRWTEEEARWFVRYVPGHSESEISAEHERLFGDPLTESQIANAKTRFGVKSGTVGGRFVKGQTPPNKGKMQTEFMTPEGIERTKATRFKKGDVPHNAKGGYVGRERVGKDGYIQVQVSTGLQDGPNRNFRMKHHVVWEEHNGPIPPHTMIVFADRDKRNFDPGNLVAVPRRLLAVISRMGMAYCDRETLEACMARAELHSAISRKRKGK